VQVSNNNWVDVIFSLCVDDITKLDEVCERPILEVMNWLSYKKEQTDRANQIQNNYR